MTEQADHGPAQNEPAFGDAPHPLHPSQAAPPPSTFWPGAERTFKWLAAIAATFSILFAIQKVIEGMSDGNDRKRQITELRAVAASQQKAADYSMAWDNLDRALGLAETGGAIAKLFGGMDDATREVRAAREDLAMEWLRNIRTSGSQTFTEIVSKILPPLDQVAASTDSAPTRRADVLAHIGWAYFLRVRDGATQLNPETQYEAALALDSANMYAHTHLGHWIMWQGGDAQDAMKHFDAALAGNREREYVRQLELAAFRNRGSGGDAGFVGVVADMLAKQESVRDDARRDALWTIDGACRSGPRATDLARLQQGMSVPIATVYELLQSARRSPPTAKEQLAVIDACRKRLARVQK